MGVEREDETSGEGGAENFTVVVDGPEGEAVGNLEAVLGWRWREGRTRERNGRGWGGGGCWHWKPHGS